MAVIEEIVEQPKGTLYFILHRDCQDINNNPFFF
jgi:hypothetical protein